MIIKCFVLRYKKGAELEPSDYAMINLATLLVAAGKSFDTDKDLKRLSELLVGAFINKRARLLQSLVFFFNTDSKRRNFCSLCSTKQIPPKPPLVPRKRI